MIKIDVVVVAIGLSTLASCSPGDDMPVAVALENNPFIKLPRARAEIASGSVIISTVVDATTDAGAGFEALQQGRGYHAWAMSGGNATHLGSFTPGVELEAELAGSADEVLISIEEGTPTAPSSTIAVRGALDDALSFGDLDAVSFSGARATAIIVDGSIDLEYQGMPELPEGYRYELWMSPLGDEGEPVGEALAVGGLEPGAGAMARFESEELPEQFDLQVAIEVAGGRGAMSPALCLELVHSHDEHGAGSHDSGGSSGGSSGGGHEH